MSDMKLATCARSSRSGGIYCRRGTVAACDIRACNLTSQMQLIPVIGAQGQRDAPPGRDHTGTTLENTDD